MKTVLMFPYANHLGGTQPLVAIAQTLRESGYNVVFAARGKCRTYIEECGFDVEDVLELDPERSVAYINKSSLDYHTRESVAEFVAAERALIEKHDADVVVDLHRPTLKLSALLTGTPRAVLCNTVLTRYYAGEKFLPESHPLSSVVKFLPESILRPVSAWAEEKLFESWVRPYNAYLEGRSGVRFASMKDLFEGEATILMDAPEFAPSVGLPPHVHAVGPLVHEQSERIPPWYSRLDPRKKSIFVYLGSYGEQFTRIVDYLGRMLADAADYQIVAATGGLYGYSGVVVSVERDRQRLRAGEPRPFPQLRRDDHARRARVDLFRTAPRRAAGRHPEPGRAGMESRRGRALRPRPQALPAAHQLRGVLRGDAHGHRRTELPRERARLPPAPARL